MNHVMVHAEFPGAEQEHLNEIHAWLSQRNWIQIAGSDNEPNNIWHGTFNRRMLEKDCHAVTLQSFIEASKRYCEVELQILWAATKPIRDAVVLLR